MSNPKNELQEFCQKRGFPLPEYQLEGHRYEKEGNKNFFRSRVTIEIWYDHDRSPCNFIGPWKTTKKEAEMAAAEFVLMTSMDPIEVDDTSEVENSPSLEYVPPSQSQTTHVVLLDIENRPKLVDLPWKETTHRIGFISKYSNHVDNQKEIEQICQLHIIESAASNAADIALIFYAGQLVTSFLNENPETQPIFVIVSRDKFAGPLQKLIQDHFGLECEVAMIKDDLVKLGCLAPN